jgi:hypothetical protein
MFRSICIEATLVVLLASAPVANGQTTVWLSDNATFADLDITTAAPPGTTGSFDIWIKTEHSNRVNSIGLDLMTMGNAIQFTGAEIVIGTDRFHAFGTTVADDGTVIENMSAFAGVGLELGSGIGPGVPVDDVALGAYRFATIHYRVAGLGSSELQLKVGEFAFDWTFGGPNILQIGIDDPISENVAGATDMIIDGRIQVVPEPDSLLLLLISTWSLFMRGLRRSLV